MPNGHYWVRIKSFHKGQWTVARNHNGRWLHCDRQVTDVVEVGNAVNGPPL
jgi:hypothetical protein